MLREFILPDVGEGLTEADIVAWHVKPGEAVEDGQIIVEIETAKAVVELPCPWDGTVTRLLAEEGQTVEVGVPIIVVEVAGQATPDRAERASVPAPAPAESTPDDEAPAEESGAHSVLVGYGVKTSSTTRRARRTAAGRPETAEVPTAPEEPVEPAEVPAEPGAPAAKALAKPPVRKLAKDLGISLAALAGSGPDGSITRDDVQRAATADTQARSAQSADETATRATRPVADISTTHGSSATSSGTAATAAASALPSSSTVRRGVPNLFPTSASSSLTSSRSFSSDSRIAESAAISARSSSCSRSSSSRS